MAAQLPEAPKVLRRQVKVYGVEMPCILDMNTEGLTLAVKGSKKRLWLTWAEVARAMHTPDDVPAHFAGQPLEFLQYQAAQKVKRAARK
jgi:hypothetical protein